MHKTIVSRFYHIKKLFHFFLSVSGYNSCLYAAARVNINFIQHKPYIIT